MEAVAGDGEPVWDTEDDLVELRGRAQQHAPLNGPVGHLDEAPAFWDEAKFSTHAQEKSENQPRFLHFSSDFLAPRQQR
jgi:hypothetical protein